MDDLKQEAAQSLVERAMEAADRTKADFLLGTAKRLDPVLDTGKFRAEWRRLQMELMDQEKSNG